MDKQMENIQHEIFTQKVTFHMKMVWDCLLYTSDAADEDISV